MTNPYVELAQLPSIKHAKQLNNICEPLFNYLGFTCFSYNKFYLNQDCFTLNTEPKLIKTYWEKKIFEVDDQVISPLKYFSGYYFWNSDYHESFIKNVINYLNIASDVPRCGVTKYIKHKGYAECFMFFGGVDEDALLTIKDNYTPLLDEFIKYFFNQAVDILLFAENNLSNFITLSNQDYSKTTNFIEQAIIHKTSNQDYDGFHKYLINKKSSTKINNPIEMLPGLTKRQSECAHWMLQGKTVEETALILGLASGSVRNYIEAAKLRLNCMTKTSFIIEVIKLKKLHIYS